MVKYYKARIGKSDKNCEIVLPSQGDRIILAWPAESKEITSALGLRRLLDENGQPIYEENDGCKCHYGIDIGGKGRIYAAADGILVEGGNKNDERGNYLILEHAQFGTTTYRTTYMHMKSFDASIKDQKGNLKIDMEIKKGQILGQAGETGLTVGDNPIHLHFQLSKKDVINKKVEWIAVDPCGLFESGSTRVMCSRKPPDACA